MTQEQRIDRRLSAALVIAAVLPFLPAAWEFLNRGVPDVLFTGDGAALELRLLHAARGVQLLGPYSLFGWSHPGPAYFYLALPIYEFFGERGPALNLFALIVNAVSAAALVLTTRRLLGWAAALAMAVLVAVFVSVGAPFVVTNEWNPIIPMLPLALLTMIAVSLSLGESRGLPIAAFLASAVIQTHVGYGAPVAALAGVVIVARWRTRATPLSRNTRLATAAVLAVMWALPLYEAATSRPGNIQWLIEFFAPDNLAKQSWAVAWASLREQAAVAPLALGRTLGISVAAAPALQTLIFVVQCALLVLVMVRSFRSGDRILVVLAAVPLAQWAVALLAVRAIRQTMEFYLVAWISVIGLTATFVLTVWVLRTLVRRFGSRVEAMLAMSALVVMALALLGGADRPPVFREADPVVETLAREVESALRTNQVERPLVRIESRDAWAPALAVILHLSKRRVPLYVEEEWLHITGRQLAPPAGAHRELHFAVLSGVDQLPNDAILSRATGRPDIVAYLVR